MKNRQVAVATATGMCLDWMVAMATGMDKVEIDYVGGSWPAKVKRLHIVERVEIFDMVRGLGWSPTTDWAIGGPIIDRFKPDLGKTHFLAVTLGNEAFACIEGERGLSTSHGPTYLVAAMRVIVLAVIGPQVDVPEEVCDDEE